MTLTFMIYTAGGNLVARHRLSFPAARLLQSHGYIVSPTQ